ncbi:MAG: trehalose-phosphatase [Acidobacteria bacterium]|nr:trehalose-phosphatase [Acidobacteriota bacterium]
MKVLKGLFDPDRFFQNLGGAGKRALLLDYDGTLAPFQAERDQAVPYPGVRKILSAIIEREHTRVVLISGRSIESLIPLLGLKKLPEIWGSHGHERLIGDDVYLRAWIDESARLALAKANSWAKAADLENWCEQKPGCIALHLRGRDLALSEEIQEKVARKWSAFAREGNLSLQAFDGGIELRAAGRGKGEAVETILAETGEDTVVAYLGDDVTDEDAFRALDGADLSVLVRYEFRPTAADLWLKPPEELSGFLTNWLEATGEEKCRRIG